MLSRTSQRSAAVARSLTGPWACGLCTIAPDVLIDRHAAVAQVTLNRPKAMNALNLSMVRTLTEQLLKLNSDPSVAAVVLQGAGGRAFCAGGDIKVLTAGKDGAPEARAAQEAFFREEYTLDHLIARSSAFKPYVALLEGLVIGGGFGVSIGASVRVATDSTHFSMPETGIGLFPDVGGSYYLPRLAPGLGMYMALTGSPITGAAAVQAGLATHYVKPESMAALKADLGQCQSGAQVEDLVQGLAASREEVTALAADADHVKHASLIEQAFTHNSVLDIVSELGAALSRAEDDASATWVKRSLKTLQRVSPTSLAVTFQAQQAGSTMSLEDVFKMEFAVALNCMRGVDFYEGVRAQLVDKDRKPVWQPSTLQQLEQASVDGHFKLPQGVQGLELMKKQDMVDSSGILDETPRM